MMRVRADSGHKYGGRVNHMCTVVDLSTLVVRSVRFYQTSDKHGCANRTMQLVIKPFFVSALENKR